MRTRLAISISLVVLWLCAGIAHAQAPRAAFRLDEDPYADVPFHLDAIVEGFDETPAPALPKLEIAGAKVTAVGAQPNVSRSIQIINGRRMDSTRVTWILRYRIETAKAGTLRVPTLAIAQGSKQAVASGAEIEVQAVPVAADMKLELVLPARPIYVGESVPAQLVWTFARQASRPKFSVPLASLDTFTITAPPVTDPRQAIELDVGGKTIAIPYETEQVTLGGRAANRLTASFFVAPRTVPPGGKLEIPPSTVAVQLAVGQRDFFGDFRTRLFRATDVARTVEVQPLPATDRPPTFAGAVGDQFAIEVRTSRSVVQLGEPVQLAITIRSNQRLDELALGKLDGEGRLPRDKFTVPDEPPTGTLSDDGKTKTFEVVAQVTGPATEVPAIAFAYFDPVKRAYQTIHSQPIALSVKGGSVVGAGDVVSATPAKRSGATAAADDDSAVVNADLALSSPGAVDDRPLGGPVLWTLVALLYLVPLALLGYRTWRLRTANQREEAAEVRAARRRVEELLDRAGTAPAREIAGPLVAALRDLARVLGRAQPGDDGGLLATLETESFAPDAAGRPLSTDLRSNAAGLLRRWLQEARRARGGKRAPAAAALVLVALAGGDARADALADGRAAYQEAMALRGDPTARRTAFARAAVALGEAAQQRPANAELLADWGNAALGAGDVATATLAYRRALALDGSNARARRNLASLRSRQPDALRPIASAGATDTLLFFHAWPRAHRLLVGAAAFAIAVLLVVPWGGRRRRALVGVAVLPLAVWLALLVSVLGEARATADAIVMDSAVLRAADSAGAPAALTQPLPRGAEVAIVERRDAWTRIRIANGTTGWVPAGAVETVRR